MTAPTTPTGDRCPGALRLHHAADGDLARIRIPGGLLTPQATRTLAHLATTLGDGHIRLTARGNAEIRGIPTGSETDLATNLTTAGLLPSPAHERIRNIVTTPTAGLDEHGNTTGTTLTDLLHTLDNALISDPELAQLSGRFLFGIDDGRGDALALEPDLALTANNNDHWTITAAGTPLGVTHRTDAPTALTLAAHTHLATADTHNQRGWRLTDHPNTPALITTIRDTISHLFINHTPHTPTPHTTPPPLGLIPHPTNTTYTIAIRLPLAAAPAETWQHFADIAEHGDNLIRTTPARTILIANLTHHHATTALTHLSTLGLITDTHAPLAHVTTCTGLPGCTSALADVQYAAVTHHTPSNSNTPVHWSACPRRCGRPTTDHVQVLATETGWTTALVNTTTPGHPATNQHPVTDENLTTDITNRRQEITS